MPGNSARQLILQHRCVDPADQDRSSANARVIEMLAAVMLPNT